MNRFFKMHFIIALIYNIIKYKNNNFKVRFYNFDVRLKISSIYKLFLFFSRIKKKKNF